MSTSRLLVREGSELHSALREAALNHRCVLFAGLAGVGKTLMIQQLVQVADAEGRSIHLLQWDAARGAFETPEILARYPEVDGTTHAAIRKAVGLWARGAVSAWNADHPDQNALLIGEVPLIGNRLIELVKPAGDGAESLLSSGRTLFLVPIPTPEVRAAITAARTREMEDPRHERELANAAPHLVEAHWIELQKVAMRFGLTSATPSPAFDPDLYGDIYLHLLRHRQARRLPISEVLPVELSAYDVGPVVRELSARPQEVHTVMREVGRIPEAALEADVAAWYDF